jgi:uncharacterized protein with HEPN domain
MTEKETKYLSDILISAEHIFAFTRDITSYNLYEKNFLVKSAVERHLGIIGEAVNKFLKESKENELTSAQQIISLRNRLIHSYDNVDDRIIWNIIRKYLPALRNEVESKLNLK